MRRNLDLVREILSEVEDSDPFAPESEGFQAGQLAGQWEIKKISYHLVLLLEDGFLTRSTLHNGKWYEGNEQEEDAGLRLTWKGHDLLEELKDQTFHHF